MRKAANQQRRWRAADILRRARFLDDAGPIRLVDIEAVAPISLPKAHAGMPLARHAVSHRLYLIPKGSRLTHIEFAPHQRLIILIVVAMATIDQMLNSGSMKVAKAPAAVRYARPYYFRDVSRRGPLPIKLRHARIDLLHEGQIIVGWNIGRSLSGDLREERRCDPARFDKLEDNAERVKFKPDRLAEAFQREFRRQIDACRRQADDTAAGTYIDNQAALPLAKPRQDGPDHVHNAKHVHIEVGADLCVVDSFENTELAKAGVVYDHIDRTKSLRSRGDCVHDADLVGDVQVGLQDIVMFDGLTGTQIAHRSDNVPSALREEHCCFGANTGGGARDEDGFGHIQCPF